MIKRAIICALTAALPIASLAENRIAIGGESFKWREHAQEQKILEESGNRGAIWWEGTAKTADSAIVILRTKIYYGKVDYDGALFSGEPFRTNTQYYGLGAEAVFRERHEFSPHSIYGWVGEFSLGVDGWVRTISNPNLSTDQKETYTAPFVRLGLGLADRGRWSFVVGGKVPFSTKEKANTSEYLGGKNLAFKPKSGISPYADLEVKLSEHWRVGGYWDGFQFKKSQPAEGTEFYQPDSTMVTIGGKLIYAW